MMFGVLLILKRRFMGVSTMADLRLPDINQVTIAGRLTRDPEVKYIESGTRLCNLNIVCSKKYSTKNGEKKEDTLFISCSLWGESGKWISDNLHKGDAVLVDGSLKMDEWDDKATGQKRTALKINAHRVQSLAWPDKGEQSGGGQQQGGGYGGNTESPKQRNVEEPIPEDDIPF